jgi:hypothetical protein
VWNFVGASQSVGLKHGDTAPNREPLDCTGLGLQATTGGTVGLRKYRDQLVAFGHQTRQRPLSELRRAGED